MNDNIISHRITAARENLGISKTEASRRLNLSKIGYCRYEYGERTPSPQTLEVIAQCFGTSVEYLTGETNDIEPNKLVIDKTTNPELFELLKVCSSYDKDTVKRIAIYASALINNDL